jgi:phytanoyl-CoA hydroxylase
MPHSLEPQLFVNDGPLPSTSIAALQPSSLDLPLSELRRRLNSDGYLFLKGLLPRENVLKAREKYFTFLSPSGVLKPDTSPVLGIFDAQKDISLFPGIGAGAAGANTDPGQKTTDFVQLAIEAHGEPWYTDEFCKHKTLMEFMSKFTGWEEKTLSFKRTLLRNNIPGAPAIGVHYDQIFLRHGDPTSITVWVPMGDISLQGGGLIYLENGVSKPLAFQFLTLSGAVSLISFRSWSWEGTRG